MRGRVNAQSFGLNPLATVHPSVRGRTLVITTWIGRGLFKAAALVGAFVLIVILWWWDASLLTTAADENLRFATAAPRADPANARDDGRIAMSETKTGELLPLSPLEDEPAIENLPEPVALTREQLAAQARSEE